MTPFAEFLPEGDISIVGVPGIPLILYNGSNSALAVYAGGAADPVCSKVPRDQVWGYLSQQCPELRNAYRRYHRDNNGLTWTEEGAEIPTEGA